MTINAGLMSSATPEWYTPSDLVEQIRAFLGVIDLDPCADPQRRIPAMTHYQRGGLDLPWDVSFRTGYPSDTTAFMNPPYGRTIGLWVAKALREPVGEVVMLLPARTDTRWFQPILAETSVCFLKGRLHFSNAKNSAPFPSALAYRGHRHYAFADAFGRRGAITTPFGWAIRETAKEVSDGDHVAFCLR